MSDDPVEAAEPTPAAEAKPAGGRHRRESPAQPRGTRSLRSLATLIMALLCLPVIVAALIFWQQTPSSNSGPSLVSASNETAVTAARTAVHTILSYDYRQISQNIAQAKSQTTGVFAQKYATTASQLLSEAKQVQAIVQATVGSAGVVSAAPNQVVVLLFVDQAAVRHTPGQKTPTTRIDQSRVRVTMSRVNGRWLVSDLAAL